MDTINGINATRFTTQGTTVALIQNSKPDRKKENLQIVVGF